MPAYGSTKLRAWKSYCPAALQAIEDGRDLAPSDVFAAGTAAHACLDALQIARGDREDEVTMTEAIEIVDRVRVALIAGSRVWRGAREAPMLPASAHEGAEIALAWHAKHGTVRGARSEIGLGWSLEPDPDAPLRVRPALAPDYASAEGYRTALDLFYVRRTVDEDTGVERVAVVSRDYKTAPNVSQDSTRTDQMKKAALLAIDAAPRVFGLDRYEIDEVVIEVCSVRDRRIYSETYDAADTILETWRLDLAAEIVALETMERPRPASPSSRCYTCPLFGECGPGRAALAAPLADLDVESEDGLRDAARRLMSHRAESKRIGDALRRVLAERSPVDLGDGVIVGYAQTETRELADDSSPGAEETSGPRSIAQAWVDARVDHAARGIAATWTRDLDPEARVLADRIAGEIVESVADSIAALIRRAELGTKAAERLLNVAIPGRKKADVEARREVMARAFRTVSDWTWHPNR